MAKQVVNRDVLLTKLKNPFLDLKITAGLTPSSFSDVRGEDLRRDIQKLLPATSVAQRVTIADIVKEDLKSVGWSKKMAEIRDGQEANLKYAFGKLSTRQRAIQTARSARKTLR